MKKLLPLLLLSLTFLFGACSGGEEQQAAETAEQGQELTLDIYGLNQFRFAVKEAHPNVRTSDTLMVDGEEYYRVEEIMTSPGQTVNLTLTTVSSMPAAAMQHNWLMLEQGANVEEFAMASLKAKDNGYVATDMEEQIIAMTGLVAGGESESVTFDAPEETGTYEYICTFPGHFSGGMRGILTVEEQM